MQFGRRTDLLNWSWTEHDGLHVHPPSSVWWGRSFSVDGAVFSSSFCSNFAFLLLGLPASFRVSVIAPHFMAAVPKVALADYTSDT